MFFLNAIATLSSPSFLGRVNKQLAKKMRELRGDITLRNFTKRIGVSKSTLHRIEAGENVSLDTLEQISKQLKCSVADLITSTK